MSSESIYMTVVPTELVNSWAWVFSEGTSLNKMTEKNNEILFAHQE